MIYEYFSVITANDGCRVSEITLRCDWGVINVKDVSNASSSDHSLCSDGGCVGLDRASIVNNCAKFASCVIDAKGCPLKISYTCIGKMYIF